MQDQLLEQVRRYVDDTIIPYLEVPGNEEKYPASLLSDLASMGVFGVLVPVEYGGQGLPPAVGPKLNEELARGWQSLIALIGTHTSMCAYFLNCATEEQKRKWLPALAKGDVLAAHAYHEKSKPRVEDITTRLHVDNGNLVVSGQKDWCTNAANANMIMTICRNTAHGGISAVWVDPTKPGVQISGDMPRTGIKGVPLNAVTYNEVPVSAEDIIGGLDADLTAYMQSRGRGADISFAARSLGAVTAIYEEVAKFVAQEDNPLPSRRYVNAHRLTEMQAHRFTIAAVLDAALNDSGSTGARSASFAKVVASRTAQSVVDLAFAIVGGSAYASFSQRLHRACRDATSLTLVDTTNGTLMGAITDGLV